MSVEPGFGGQSFMNSSLEKLRNKKIKKENNYNFIIQVDGGISDNNSKDVIDQGAENLLQGHISLKALKVTQKK